MAKSLTKEEMIIWITKAESFIELQMIQDVVIIDANHYPEHEKWHFFNLIERNAYKLELQILNRYRNGEV